LTAFFRKATVLYVNNTDCSPVRDIDERTELLNLVTAHLAQLSGVLSADGKPGPTGRVTSATQGSVSASFGGPSTTGNDEAFWMQTGYGYQYWEATAKYRTMHYIPRPTVY
jgi:hypothetical protein